MEMLLGCGAFLVAKSIYDKNQTEDMYAYENYSYYNYDTRTYDYGTKVHTIPGRNEEKLGVIPAIGIIGTGTLLGILIGSLMKKNWQEFYNKDYVSSNINYQNNAFNFQISWHLQNRL